LNRIQELPTQLGPLQRNGSWRYLLSWVHYKDMDPGGTYSVGSITKKWILELPTQLGPLQRNGSWRYLLSWVHYKDMDPGGTYSLGSITKTWILEVPTQWGPLQRTNLCYWPTVKRQAHLGNNMINRKCSPAAKWARVIVTLAPAVKPGTHYPHVT